MSDNSPAPTLRSEPYEPTLSATTGISHIGPSAEDFHAAFGFNGPSDKMTADSDRSVALECIKGLINRVAKLKADNDSLGAVNDKEAAQIKR